MTAAVPDDEVRRQLQAATSQLAESELRVRRLYEATPAILHSIGPDGRILHVSDRWLALLDYRRDEVVGRPSSDFLAPASQAYARDVVLPAFFRDGRCDRVEYQFVRRDGTIVDVLLSAVLERDESGAPARSLAVLEDVTATRALQKELGLTHAHLDAVVCGILMVLVAIVLADSLRVWVGILRGTADAEIREAPFVLSQLQAEEL